MISHTPWFGTDSPVLSQVVDDEQQHTLVAASTLMPEIRGQLNGTGGANKVVTVLAIIAQQLPQIFLLHVLLWLCTMLISVKAGITLLCITFSSIRH